MARKVMEQEIFGDLVGQIVRHVGGHAEEYCGN